MPRYAVSMVLCREVTVEVSAPTAKAAKDAATDRARWLRSEGMRSPLRLLCVMEAEPVQGSGSSADNRGDD